MSVAERPSAPPAELDDEQRAAVIAFFKANPEGGNKAALRAAGIMRCTKAEARALIRGDGEVMEQVWGGLGVGEARALATIGEIMADPSHKDRLRAATFVANAFHGWAEYQRREVSGEGGGPVAVRVEHDVEALVRGLEEVGLIRRGPAAAVDAAPVELLPARAD